MKQKGGVKMNPNPTPENRPVNTRRRKPSKFKIFKEAYLPAILALCVVVLIVVFIVGAISSAGDKKQEELDASIAASIAQQEAYEALLQQAEKLMDEAKKSQNNAYAPYSNYHVGAALMCRNGRIYHGSNVESAAYTPTSCAERTALAKAVSEGEKELWAVAVVGGKDGSVVGGCTPCGVCRQLLYELGDGDMLVFTLDENNKILCRRMDDLLPDGFSGKAFIG
jgi:cytidine deaminase